MALAATTEWDVRSTADDTNGGGFDTASTGTDRTQQDAAFTTFTDLVIDATTNTKLTSAAHPFGATDVGNVINITSGTGFTTGRYQVVSVTSNVATMDRAVGTVGSTGGNGKLGGSLATPQTAFTAASVTGQTVHIKNTGSNYTTTATFTFTAGLINIIGYNATHRDNGTPPLLTTATNSVDLFDTQGVTEIHFVNLSMSSTAGTRGNGVVCKSGSDSNLIVQNCIMDGFSSAINGDNVGARFVFNRISITFTEIKNSVSTGILLTGGQRPCSIISCSIHDNGADGFKDVSAFQKIEVRGSVFWHNTGKGMNLANGSSVEAINSDFVNNTADGVAYGSIQGVSANTPPAVFINCIFYGNGTSGTVYGLNLPTGGGFVPNEGTMSYNNAFGNNRTGDSLNFAGDTGRITLTADPFVNASGGNFKLNGTAGGGAALKGAAYPSSFPGGVTTNNEDVGAIQTGASTTLVVHPGY